MGNEIEDDDDDLWGELPDVSRVEIPEDLLFEQGEHLKQKTRGALIGGVRHVGDDRRYFTGCDVELSFEIDVPRMDNYIFQLLIVGHKMVPLYPVRVRVLHDNWSSQSFENAKSLRDGLRVIFRHPDTRSVIAALLAHAQDPRSRLKERKIKDEQQSEASSESDDDLPF